MSRIDAIEKQKLLIVEDDPGLQTQLRWAYEDYQVLVAGTREEALALLRAEEPAVVTLDLGLPPDPDGVSEGFRTLKEILALAPDTRVIIASGHDARESALTAMAAGAAAFGRRWPHSEEGPGSCSVSPRSSIQALRTSARPWRTSMTASGSV